MAQNTIGKYFFKTTENAAWTDFATRFPYVCILSVDGMGARGDSVSTYDEQWNSSETDDFQITSVDAQTQQPKIIRKNIDIDLTFICGERYGAQDTQTCYDEFVNFITAKDFWIKSGYTGLMSHVVCLKSFKPTATKLKRGTKSYAMATVPLHCLEPSTVAQDVVVGDMYIGFGDDALTSMSEVTGLTNVQHYNVDNYAGTYTVTNPSTAYLWVCVRGVLDGYSVKANGFEVPMNSPLSIGDYRCYRTTNGILAHTMTFNIVNNS